MPEKQREKLQFPTNVPVAVTLGKNFKSGSGEYGNWHGWNVFEGGEEKVVFAKDALHNKIKDYGEGAKLTICYAEKRGADGKPYHEWQVSNGQPGKTQGSPKTEYQRVLDRPVLNIEAHLLACADIAAKLAEKLGLLDDSASIQACFATVAIDCQRHNVILGDSSPSEPSESESDNGRKEALVKGVRSACKLLNDEGYDPPFTPKVLDEYISEKFEATSIAELSAEDTEDLIQMLSEKLDNFRLNKTVGEEFDDSDVAF